MILFDIIKLNVRTGIARTGGFGLHLMTVAFIVFFVALACSGLYGAAWLDTYHPRIFSILLMIVCGGYVVGFLYWNVLRLLKSKRERYRMEDDQ